MCDDPIMGETTTPLDDAETFGEFIAKLDELTGPYVKCPVCERTSWAVHDYQATLAPHHPEAAPLRLALYLCLNCRYVRSHLLNPQYRTAR